MQHKSEAHRGNCNHKPRNHNALSSKISLICEIIEVIKLLDVSDVVFAADFENASGFAVLGLVCLQIY